LAKVTKTIALAYDPRFAAVFMKSRQKNAKANLQSGFLLNHRMT
jgi:hypothetical protein